MLVFIIPLKSPQASKSWNYVSKLFERCLKSVCNQTSSNFRVIVVCNQKPDIEFEHSSVNYIQVNFPVPAPTYGDRSRDKASKILTGLRASKDLPSSHVMPVDADDCVSKHLAEFVNQTPHCNGWFVNKGYIYEEGSKYIYLRSKNFYKLCGTSNIFRQDLYSIPKIDEHESTYLYYISHNKAREIMIKKETPLEPLPFAGSVYISAANQENITFGRSFYDKLRKNPKSIISPVKYKVIKIFDSRFLDDLIREEFGIYPIIL
jgi:hypothetical protein